MAGQYIISGSNLSQTWGEALLKCYEAPGGVMSPAVVEFSIPENGSPIESIDLKSAINGYLGALSEPEESIETVAGTIFPQSIWRLAQGNRAKFFELYAQSAPRILRCRANHNGIYFNRMIAFADGSKIQINQLEHIITTWNAGNSRRSALQAAIFNPFSDHTDQRQRGFPCLQQVAFYPQGANGCDGLAVIGFYATQTLIEKGYGNYLGLYRLGKFMAQEMNLRLSKVTCIAAALKLSNGKSKRECATLVEKVKALMDNGN